MPVAPRPSAGAPLTGIVTDVARTFGSGPHQALAAREFTRSVITGWGLDSDDAVLVVSELAANALSHATGGFGLFLQHTEHTLLIEVSDQQPNTPTLRHPADTDSGGRGLLIVDRLARSWGTRNSTPAGKVVWAELDTRRSPF